MQIVGQKCGRFDARASLCALLAVSQHLARNVSAHCVPVMALPSLFLSPDDDDDARESPSAAHPPSPRQRWKRRPFTEWHFFALAKVVVRSALVSYAR